MRNKKGQGITTEKILVVVLVLLVVVLVLWFYFKADVLKYFRNLPGYTYDEEREIDAGDSSEESEKLCFGKPGEDIGKIRDAKSENFGPDFNQFYVFINGKNTKLYLAGKFGSKKMGDYKYIKYAKGKDVIVANIGNEGRIEVIREIQEISEYLDKLDGAYILNGNLICKQK